MSIGLLYESLQQICFSIERLEPCDQSLHKLLSLTTAAHLLLADEEMDETPAAFSRQRQLALENINIILEEKLYLHSKQAQLHRFDLVKGFILQSIDEMHT